LVKSDRTREDEWFLKNEKQLVETASAAREKRQREKAASEQADERRRLKELHFMKCPKCGHDMKEGPVEGVLVDRCSFCEGLYMDAGELEKLFLRKMDERRGFLRKLIGL
jgi:hypothetical protein